MVPMDQAKLNDPDVLIEANPNANITNVKFDLVSAEELNKKDMLGMRLYMLNVDSCLASFVIDDFDRSKINKDYAPVDFDSLKKVGVDEIDLIVVNTTLINQIYYNGSKKWFKEHGDKIKTILAMPSEGMPSEGYPVWLIGNKFAIVIAPRLAGDDDLAEILKRAIPLNEPRPGAEKEITKKSSVTAEGMELLIMKVLAKGASREQAERVVDKTLDNYPVVKDFEDFALSVTSKGGTREQAEKLFKKFVDGGIYVEPEIYKMEEKAEPVAPPPEPVEPEPVVTQPVPPMPLPPTPPEPLPSPQLQPPEEIAPSQQSPPIVVPEPEDLVPDVLSGKSLDELEAELKTTKDLAYANKLCLEIIKHPNFDWDLTNSKYNGLGVEIEMGAEGTYGKGIQLKRALNLQQFYTHPLISYLIKEILKIPDNARVIDPTCGSGRLFTHMPNKTMCHGIEIESNAYKIAKALYPSGQIIQDDIMFHMYKEDFNYIIANPPFTLMLEDRAGLYNNTGYDNKIVSEVAVMEFAIRSLKSKGYMAFVMPRNVLEEKFYDRKDFMKFFKSNISPIAFIELPSTTHKGTEWPVALFIFKKESRYYYNDKDVSLEFPFVAKLESMKTESIDKLVKTFEKDHDCLSDAIGEYVKDIFKTVGEQPPYPMKVSDWQPKTISEYLKSATTITSEDKVSFEVDKTKLESFRDIPIIITPSGLHADLKVKDIAARFPREWSPVRHDYVDVFGERVCKLDMFLDEKMQYDNIQLVKLLHQYDIDISHGQSFLDSLKLREKFMEMQNIPYEIWVDKENNNRWELLYQKDGLKEKFPEIFKYWKAKLDALENDPRFVTFLKFQNVNDNWIKYLFQFQKDDCVRAAGKKSVIMGHVMGCGKTRIAIATALLKGHKKNLFVAGKKFLSQVWEEEFQKCKIPYKVIEYKEDLADLDKYEFFVIAYEALKNKNVDRSRPKRSSRFEKNPNGSDIVDENPDDDFTSIDAPSELDREVGLEELYDSMGMDISDADMMSISKNPEDDEDEGDEEEEGTSEEAKLKKLAEMPMFVNNIRGVFDLVVIDEAHYMANPLTARTESVRRLDAKEWIMLTGTPVQNRVRGLLSLLIIGWGEQTRANPYSKAEFLEKFTQYKEVDKVMASTHGYKKSKKKEVELPSIQNPDDLVTLMMSKIIRRNRFEPDVVKDIKFPTPDVRIRKIKPSKEESTYTKQWYDEFQRLRVELETAQAQLQTLRDQKRWGGANETQVADAEAQYKLLAGLSIAMIDKLRFVAILPQIDPFEASESKTEKEEGKSLKDYVKIPEKYKGGLTTRQNEIVKELVRRVKNGEQCYTIVRNPAFNDWLKSQLDPHGIKSAIIKGGQTRKNDTTINEFKDKKIDILLATFGTFDVGINIPDASYCCIVHPEWNYSTMAQSYSRMIRPQSQGVREIDIFVLEKSIEDYVWQLADMKRVNSEYVFDYGPKPPETEWFGWTDAVDAMFADIQDGAFDLSSEGGKPSVTPP
jgi:SNF2 family DNA or RNA helicase